VVKVSDHEIEDAAQSQTRNGLVVEGAAAAAIASVCKLRVGGKTRIRCVISGSGLKFHTTFKQLLRRSTESELLF
jgi:threonine synthase